MITVIKSVEDYIKKFPKDIQVILTKIRGILEEKAPEAIESISYGMPAYKINKKPLVYFAAFKNHIGFYATPNAHSKFTNKLSKYKQGKGSVQFPIKKSIPYELIAEIVEFKVKENTL